jgi:putative transposase
MRRLLTGYALWYNRRHRRYGHLFQNRFKSILCQENVYLLELVRYIHLNPVRAHLVEDLDELDRYAYSGHSVLLGKAKNSWQQTQQVLGMFGDKPGAARRAYRFFVEKGRELGIPMSSLARKLGLSVPSVSESVTRGQRLAEEKGLFLLKT